MIYLEKLKAEHPESVAGAGFSGRGCPNKFGYTTDAEDNEYCVGHTCSQCWNREIPESKEPMDYEKEIEKKNKEIADMRKELERLKTYETCKKGADDCATFLKCFIDAGFTREEAFQILLTGMKTGINK